MIKHGDFIELGVAAKVIEMGVRINNYHRFISYFFYGLTQVANSTTGVDQGRLLLSYKQIDDSRLVVSRLVENKKVSRNLIDLEPILGGGNMFKIGKSGSGLEAMLIVGHRSDFA